MKPSWLSPLPLALFSLYHRGHLCQEGLDLGVSLGGKLFEFHSGMQTGSGETGRGKKELYRPKPTDQVPPSPGCPARAGTRAPRAIV